MYVPRWFTVCLLIVRSVVLLHNQGVLQALLSVYADEGIVSLSLAEAASLQHARDMLQAPQESSTASGWDAVRLSGCIIVPDVQVEASSVTIKFALPVEYPTVKPSLQLIANAPRCC